MAAKIPTSFQSSPTCQIGIQGRLYLQLDAELKNNKQQQTIKQVRFPAHPKKLTAVIAVYEDAHCFGQVQKLYLKGQYLIIHP